VTASTTPPDEPPGDQHVDQGAVAAAASSAGTSGDGSGASAQSSTRAGAGSSSSAAPAAPYYQSDMMDGLLRVQPHRIMSAYGPYEYYNVSVDDGALRSHLAAVGLGVPDAGAFQELSRWGWRCGGRG
jgi:hypothetical protein